MMGRVLEVPKTKIQIRFPCRRLEIRLGHIQVSKTTSSVEQTVKSRVCYPSHKKSQENTRFFEISIVNHEVYTTVNTKSTV